MHYGTAHTHAPADQCYQKLIISVIRVMKCINQVVLFQPKYNFSAVLDGYLITGHIHIIVSGTTNCALQAIQFFPVCEC
jgi:hypothetical protein